MQRRGKKDTPTTPETFSQLTELFIKDVLALRTLSDSRRRSWERLLREAASGDIGRMPINSIDHATVAEILLRRWHTTPVLAQHQRSRLESVFGFAQVRGWRDGSNPAQWKNALQYLLPRMDHLEEHRASVPWSRAPEVYQRLAAMTTNRASYALRFTALTALRPGVVRRLSGEWIEGDVLSVPGAVMKMRKPYRTVLVREALALHKAASFRMSDVALAKPFRVLDIRDVHGRLVTAHGWRSTFQTWVADNHPDWLQLSEHQLAHVVGGRVYRAYQRSDQLDQRRPMMKAWAKYLTSGK